MPRMELRLFRDVDGQVLATHWLRSLPTQITRKCLAAMMRLESLGYELRRPEADYLADGIYELRVRFGHVNYRLLYFYHGRNIVVISHGVIKEQRVDPRDIDRAIERRAMYMRDPARRSIVWEAGSEL